MAEVAGSSADSGAPSSAGNSGAPPAPAEPWAAEPAAGRGGAVLRLAAIVLILAGGFLVVRLTPAGEYLTREGVGAAIEHLRSNPWAPVIFVAVYAAATALAVPGTVLTLAGGAVFGFAWGTLYNAVAANIGANAAFGVARGLGRDAVRRLAGSDSKALARLDAAVSRHGFQGLLTLRLIPLVPFNVLNFGSGIGCCAATALVAPAARVAATAKPAAPGRRTPSRFRIAGRKLISARRPPAIRRRARASREASWEPWRSASAKKV